MLGLKLKCGTMDAGFKVYVLFLFPNPFRRNIPQAAWDAGDRRKWRWLFGRS